MIPPEPLVIGADLPMRPRCFHCLAVRCDYQAADRHLFTAIGGSRDCDHQWTDRIDSADL